MITATARSGIALLLFFLITACASVVSDHPLLSNAPKAYPLGDHLSYDIKIDGEQFNAGKNGPSKLQLYLKDREYIGTLIQDAATATQPVKSSGTINIAFSRVNSNRFITQVGNNGKVSYLFTDVEPDGTVYLFDHGCDKLSKDILAKMNLKIIHTKTDTGENEVSCEVRSFDDLRNLADYVFMVRPIDKSIVFQPTD